MSISPQCLCLYFARKYAWVEGAELTDFYRIGQATNTQRRSRDIAITQFVRLALVFISERKQASPPS